MKILIVHNYYKVPGGEDTVVKNEATLLKEHGHEVYIYKRDNTEMDSYNKIRKMILPFSVVFSLKTYRDIIRIISKKKIDVVHVHNTVCLVSPSVYYAAFKKRIPVVQTIHNFRLICPGATLLRNGKICEECVGKSLFRSVKYGCYRQSRINTFALAAMETIHKWVGTYNRINYICLTEFNKKQLLRINGKKQIIDPKRIYIKPNFVKEQKKIVPYDNRKKQIVYAGRLDQSKGIRILFNAWKQIDDYKLVVCGTGPEETWCKRFVDINKINNIDIRGFVPNETVIDIIAESKALILPTQWYEGFPMVLVESFSCGTPVIGSDLGNVGSIISEGQNGYKFNSKSQQDIVKAVRKLSDISKSTVEISKELYDKEKNYQLLMSIYRSCQNKDLHS